MQTALNFNNVAIVSVKENDEKMKISFVYMSKDEPINVMRISDLKEQSRALKIIKLF